MASAFEIASFIEEVSPGKFRAIVPEGWEQGRGAFGGLVLALLLRAIEASEAVHDKDRARAARTLIGDIAGPVRAGEVEIEAHIVRRGSNQTNVRADLLQGGDLLAYASAVLSTARTEALPGFGPRIAAPPPFERVASLPMTAPGVPVFTKHFDYRPTGRAPFTGGPDPIVEGWVRAREAPEAIDAPMLIALLDAYWPAFSPTSNAPRPVATVSFTAEIAVDPAALDPRAPLFYRARTISDYQGFQLELRELYDARGSIVAMNQQTFAILK
jgi:hypothetical protein